MCGIAGIFDRQGRSGVSERLIKAMTARLSHRGPDGDGHFISAPVALGHRRLSIIDLAGGAQPMASPDQTHVVTFNGEIYNFQEIRQDLSSLGAVFDTQSDTEVLLKAYRQWGVDCVKRLRGMFAFALWDADRRALVLARDRFGKKPLHYTETSEGLFLFASEIKALLLHDSVPRQFRDDAVEDYFALGYVPDPKTIFASVHKLPAGHIMEIEEGREQPRVFAYWDLSFERETRGSFEDLKAEMLELLEESVRLRMISDVPLGAFLSGGVDSSAIVALMSKISSSPVNSCSISFDEASLDESSYARDVATRFQTSHFTKQVAVDDFDLIDRLADVFDEPFADASALPTYRVSQLARQHVAVALSGDGGDEMLAGYRRQRLHMGEEHVRNILPLVVRRPFFATLGRLYPKLDWAPQMFRAKSTFQSLALESAEAYFHSVSIMGDEERSRLFSPHFKARLNGYQPQEVFRKVAEHAPTNDPLGFIQYLDVKTNLVGDILTKTDRASMAHGLEVRAPFLDHVFAEWAASLPLEMKIRGGQGKYLLKKAMEDHLPQNILYRPKMGFVTPISHWFKGPLQQRIQSTLKSEPLLDSGLFDAARLRHLGEEHINGKRDHGRALWSLLIFESCLKAQWGAKESQAA